MRTEIDGSVVKFLEYFSDLRIKSGDDRPNLAYLEFLFLIFHAGIIKVAL
jgi:hypothetical protein